MVQCHTSLKFLLAYSLHITGFILKHGTGWICNHNRNVRLTYSFHTSCSDLDVNDSEKIKESLDMIEKMIEDADDNLEQGVPCSSEKIEVLEN